MSARDWHPFDALCYCGKRRLFMGHDAEALAKEYALWKTAQGRPLGN